MKCLNVTIADGGQSRSIVMNGTVAIQLPLFRFLENINVHSRRGPATGALVPAMLINVRLYHVRTLILMLSPLASQ